MPKNKNTTDNKSNPKDSLTKTKALTKLPGVDMELVIPSYPMIIKENSSKPIKNVPEYLEKMKKKGLL